MRSLGSFALLVLTFGLTLADENPMCACRATRCGHYDTEGTVKYERRCLVKLNDCRDNPETACALPRVCLCAPCADGGGSHSCGIVSEYFVSDANDRRPCEGYLNQTLPPVQRCSLFPPSYWITYTWHAVRFYITDASQWLELPKRTMDALGVVEVFTNSVFR